MNVLLLLKLVVEWFINFSFTRQLLPLTSDTVHHLEYFWVSPPFLKETLMFSCLTFYDFPGSSAGKGRRHWFNSWVGKTHWHRYRLPTPVFSGFPGSSAGKENACNVGDLISIPGWGRFPGEGNGYPPQCSRLENSIDCIVYGVTKTWTLLSDFHFHLLLYWCIVALQCFTLWKMAWRFLKKLKIELPYNPAIPLLDICPERERDTCFTCSLQHFLQ